MTTIEALIGIEAKRFSRAGRVSAAQKRVLYSEKIQICASIRRKALSFRL